MQRRSVGSSKGIDRRSRRGPLVVPGFIRQSRQWRRGSENVIIKDLGSDAKGSSFSSRSNGCRTTERLDLALTSRFVATSHEFAQKSFEPFLLLRVLRCLGFASCHSSISLPQFCVSCDSWIRHIKSSHTAATSTGIRVIGIVASSCLGLLVRVASRSEADR